MATNMWKIVNRAFRLRSFFSTPRRVVPNRQTWTGRLRQSPGGGAAALLSTTPFVWKDYEDHRKYMVDEEDDDEDEEDEEEEEEEQGLRREMMRPIPSREKWANWTNNAESHPQYQATVRAARAVLSRPPPPPPTFPALPPGFCADPDKVPPPPPTLPTIKFFAIYDENKNNSKLPANCPKASPCIVQDTECAAKLMMTPKIPDLPFCDHPDPPPDLPIPPPCGELGCPPPPPPDVPLMLVCEECPPPALPDPPCMAYELPEPPEPIPIECGPIIPPLPCFPLERPITAMNKCLDEENNNNVTINEVPQLPDVENRGIEKHNLNSNMQGPEPSRQWTNSAKPNRQYPNSADPNRQYPNSADPNRQWPNLPPPPPFLSAKSRSVASYWNAEDQQGMIRPRRRSRAPVEDVNQPAQPVLEPEPAPEPAAEETAQPQPLQQETPINVEADSENVRDQTVAVENVAVEAEKEEEPEFRVVWTSKRKRRFR